MKSITSLFSIFLLAAITLPYSAAALSCLDPASSLEYYVDEANYIVFTGVAGETKEHVKQAATADGNPNFQFDEGYTGQYVEVSEAHKGKIDGGLWVYHHKNSTWGYMCASGPAEVGEERVYVINPPQQLFDFPQVVNSFPTDSELAQDLLNEIESNNVQGPAYINFTTSENWDQQLRSDIKEMIFLIRIKLSEWRWWRSQ